MSSARSRYGFILSGIFFGCLLWALCAYWDLPPAACWCAFTAGVCATWWVTEALPLPATGLVPFVVFPLTGVMDQTQVAQGYGHRAILLLMGGFFLSAAMERSGVHRRIALGLVNLVGGDSGPRLVMGFMLATGLLSMWVSNTATTLMMLPIALAVLQQASTPGLRVALLLGIAYSASIGGMATPVGTPPNVLFIAAYSQQTNQSMGFMEWGRVSLPIVCVLLPTVWFVLTRGLKLREPITMPTVGVWRTSEIRVLIVFVLTALAWVFRTAPAGGWVTWIGAVDSAGKPLAGDSTVALASALALFLIPAGDSTASDNDSSVDQDRIAVPPPRQYRGLLDWETAKHIPWGILLLFGGGLALASGFQSSGLSDQIGQTMGGLSDLHPLLIVFVVCLLVNFLTELTSSTATTALLLPILAETARAAELPLAMIMIPGTIAASCAFMLPVATAPNTIVFGAGGLSTIDMARRGWALNIWSTIVISLVSWWLLGAAP
ncbi:SLC13 family permease [Planctomycetaceae bacterium SH139]